MNETLQYLILSSMTGFDTPKWGSTLVFFLVLSWYFLKIRSCYRTVLERIRKLRRYYVSLIGDIEKLGGNGGNDLVDSEALPPWLDVLRGNAGNDLADPEIKIEIRDLRKLLDPLKGTQRTSKLHFVLRGPREETRTLIANARSLTESMPIIGILGTILGLVISSLTQKSVQDMASGIWIALISSLFALSATVAVKWAIEPQTLSELENLEALEDKAFQCVFHNPIRIPDLPATAKTASQ